MEKVGTCAKVENTPTKERVKQTAKGIMRADSMRQRCIPETQEIAEAL